MIIENLTNHIIVAEGRPIDPTSRRYVSEHVFDTIDIHSDFGSAVIDIEYCVRCIKCFGNLDVVESEEIDDNGHKIIIVKERQDVLQGNQGSN